MIFKPHKIQAGVNRMGGLSKAIEFAYKSEIDGEYWEFGVWKGTSLVRAIQINGMWQETTGRKNIQHFVGFDSFEGLPDLRSDDSLDEYGVFTKGQFGDTTIDGVAQLLTEGGADPAVYDLIPGFFEDSLHDPDRVGKLDGRRVAVAHIDCDLASSADTCLEFLTDRLADGAVLIFDDWYCYRGRRDKGVHKAFNDWLARHPEIYAQDYFQYSWAGRAFIITKET